MTFEKLNKNTRKSEKDFVIGRLFCYFNKSEDGLWSRQSEDDTKRTTHLFSINIIEQDKNGEKDKALQIIIGKYNFAFAILNQGTK